MDRKRQVLLGLSSVLLIFMILSPDKDAITWLTLVLGPLLLLASLVLSGYLPLEYVTDNQQWIKILHLFGLFLPVLGMYFGSFSALFVLPIPFGYYILISILVIINLVLGLGILQSGDITPYQ